MREIIHEQDQDSRSTYAPVFAQLKKIDPDARHVLVRLTPEADGWDWLAGVRHDVEGALRSCRYLADKVAASYDPGDTRGRKVLDSIARHLATLDVLKSELVDELHRDGSE